MALVPQRELWPLSYHEDEMSEVMRKMSASLGVQMRRTVP